MTSDLAGSRREPSSLVVVSVDRWGPLRSWLEIWEEQLAEDPGAPRPGPAEGIPWITARWDAAAPTRRFFVAFGIEADSIRFVVPYRIAGTRSNPSVEVETELGPFWSAEPMSRALPALLQHLDSRLPRWSSLGFSMQNSRAAPVRDLLAAAESIGQLHSVIRTHDSPYLGIRGDYSEYRQERARKLSNALRRKEERLRRVAPLEIERNREPEAVRSAVDDLLAIEQETWKYDRRSDMTSRGQQHVFYRRFAELLAHRGEISLNVLRLDDEPVAYELDVLTRDFVYLIKHSYKERLGSFSPGVVLRSHSLAWYHAEGYRAVDFWGARDRFKMLWTDETVPHLTIRLYRDDIQGRAAFARDKLERAIASNRGWQRLHEWWVGPLERHKMKDPLPPLVRSRIIDPILARIRSPIADERHAGTPVPATHSPAARAVGTSQTELDRLECAAGPSARVLRNEAPARLLSRVVWADERPLAYLVARMAEDDVVEIVACGRTERPRAVEAAREVARDFLVALGSRPYRMGEECDAGFLEPPRGSVDRQRTAEPDPPEPETAS